jgi:predicted Zn-dependent protease
VRAAVLAIVAAASGLAGCAARTTFLGAPVPATCREILGHGRDDERCVGWAFDRLGEIATDDVYDDPALQRYVAGVAARIARANRLPAPSVRVVDRAAGTAFARPGGYVYIARTVLPVLDNEAELAALLAHELAHVAAGHASDLLDPFPAPGQDELRELRSRDDESVADERAVEYLAAAGYAPDAVRTSFVVIERARAARTVPPTAPTAGAPAVDAITGAAAMPVAAPAAAPEPPIVDDRYRFRRAIDRDDPLHPPTAERIARVTRMIAGRTTGELGAARYRAAIAGVIVGDDPRRGTMMASGTWAIARLGLAIDLPEGASEIEAVADASDTSLSAAMTAVGRGWGDTVARSLVRRRRTTVAGHPAVIGIAPADDAARPDPAAELGASLDAPRPAAHDAVAIIAVGDRVLAVYLRGEQPEARLPRFLAGVRAITAAERAASAPARLVYVAAPAAGVLGELVPRLCPLPDESRQLDDMSRRVAAGAPVKCARRGER